MGAKKHKWTREQKLCQWCFESMDRFRMYFCSEYCEAEAKRWKEGQDKLSEGQKKAMQDLAAKKEAIFNEDAGFDQEWPMGDEQL